MAALSEREMRRILGDQYDGGAAASPVADMLKRQRQKKDTVDDRKFTALAAIVMGIGLVISALATAKGNAFLIQNAVAAVLIVAGVAWHLTARRLDKKELT
jgi:hypothetical protein